MWSMTLDSKPARILSLLVSDMDGGGGTGGVSGTGSWMGGGARCGDDVNPCEEDESWELGTHSRTHTHMHTHTQILYMHIIMEGLLQA